MSDLITPVSDVLESQRIVVAEGQQRTLAARQSADDLVDRVQDDAAALAIRLAQLRGQDEVLGHVKEALTASDQQTAIRNTAILARLDELALQEKSAALSASERQAIQTESDMLRVALDRLANSGAGQPSTQVAANEGAGAPAPVDEAQAAPVSQAATDAAVRETDLILQESNVSGSLILGQTDRSVHAQANQDTQEALKLLDED